MPLLPKKQKTLAELRAENRLLKRANVATGITTVAKTLIKCGALVWISYYLYLSIAVLAGKTSFASIVVEFLGNLTVSQTVAWIFGVGGVAYGLGERRIRKRTTKQLGARNRTLEAKRDPNRSSSNLDELSE